MGKVRTDDQAVTVDIDTGSRDEVVFASDDEFRSAYANERSRWDSLAERLK